MTNNTHHYLIITMGSIGDLYPFLRMASALQAMGKKVTFISHAYYESFALEAGLAFIGFDKATHEARKAPSADILNPKKSLSVLLTDYSTQLTQIVDAIQSVTTDVPRVAISHPLCVPAAAIAKERGLLSNIVAAYLAPFNLKTYHNPLMMGHYAVPRWVPMISRRLMWQFIEKNWINPPLVPQINMARQAMHLPNIQSFLSHIASAPNLSVTLFPAWFAPAMPDWPKPFIEGNFQLFEIASRAALSKELTDFLAAGEKPLVFTAGTGNHHSKHFFNCALAAANTLGMRAIFLSKRQAHLPAHLPSSILVQPYTALSALLPHAAALIHHGGIGTSAEALRAGVPQLVTPFAWDQFDNAARLQALGVAVSVRAKRLSPHNMAARLQLLLSATSVQSQCVQVAARFLAAPNTTTLCQQIDDFLLCETSNKLVHLKNR